jgi:hypothetical protein
MGDIPWFSISLLIHADDLDPDEVTRVLGVEPDLAQRKGVLLIGARSIVVRHVGVTTCNHPRPGLISSLDFGPHSVRL